MNRPTHSWDPWKILYIDHSFCLIPVAFPTSGYKALTSISSGSGHPGMVMDMEVGVGVYPLIVSFSREVVYP
jgi:hypothetical protein